jgi:hypothetical protein
MRTNSPSILVRRTRQIHANDWTLTEPSWKVARVSLSFAERRGASRAGRTFKSYHSDKSQALSAIRSIVGDGFGDRLNWLFIHAATSLLNVGVNAQLFSSVRPGSQTSRKRPLRGHRQLEDQSHDWLIDEWAGVPSVPATLHLAPSAAHDVLAHRSAERARQRAAHAARVGVREIAAGNQGVGGSLGQGSIWAARMVDSLCASRLAA